MLDTGTLLHDYRIVRTLGRGGMASVYLAQHVVDNALVALKAVHADSQGRFPPGAVRQFRCEAEVLRALAHPNLPCVYEFLETEQHCCMVMEYVPGLTLDEVLRIEGRLGEERVLNWTRQLCDVLEYLHTRQPPIIFRDLKPGNIMLAEGEQVKLIDFGIAKFLAARAKHSTQTTARGMLSRGYAAVEQYIGGTDPRSDIYSLGATLYNLLTGEPPPESMAVARGLASPADVRAARQDVTERTAAGIEAMMQMDRDLRPSTAQGVRDVLGLLPQPRFPHPEPTAGRPLCSDKMVRAPEATASSQGPPTEKWTPDVADPSHPAAAARADGNESTTDETVVRTGLRQVHEGKPD